MLALVFDAISDPIVGYASDNLHFRWGRRHPFMYAPALVVVYLISLLFVAAYRISRATHQANLERLAERPG